MSFKARVRISAAPIARVRQETSAHRGRGECRAHDAPAASRAKLMEAHERSHHRSVRFTRHSRTRMVLTVSSALSPATNSFLSPSFCRLKVLSRPVELAKTSANLTSATDARTTRLRRTRTRLRQKASPGTASLVLHTSIAHEVHLALRSPARATLPPPPHPVPTFVTMANAPPRDRTAGLIVLICPTGEAKYFCFWSLTRFREIRSDLPVGQN